MAKAGPIKIDVSVEMKKDVGLAVAALSAATEEMSKALDGLREALKDD